MERLSDSDLESPGSLVHTMENYVGAYEDLLADSVSRKPTTLTVWMVNRILNGATKERDKWMEILNEILSPVVSTLSGVLSLCRSCSLRAVVRSRVDPNPHSALPTPHL
jgi:hypothetical protein